MGKKELEILAEMANMGVKVYYPTPEGEKLLSEGRELQEGEKPVRRLISLDEMKENKDLLKAAFDFFTERYIKRARRKGGMMTIGDFNQLIAETLNKNFHSSEDQKDIIEGFLEFLMGLMKTEGNSLAAFKLTKELIGWR